MACYRFIADEEEIRKFYRQHILPFHEKNDLSYIILPTVRRKYYPELKRTQSIVANEIFSSQKSEDRFIQVIRRLEVAEGVYTDGGKGGESLPNQAFVIYITVDPMNEVDGYYKLQQEISNRLKIRLHGGEVNPLRIKQTYKSCLHQSPEKIFLKLDVDTKDSGHIGSLRQMMKTNNIIPYMVVETKNGFHVIINRETGIDGPANKALHLFSKNKEWITIEKNALVAIPGTYQGGDHQVKMVEWINEVKNI
jgi:hypothetical protein